MFPKVLGFTAVAIVGLVSLKYVFALVGLAFGLMMKLLWLGLIGFIVYSVIKAVMMKKAEPATQTGTTSEGGAEV